jgi:hypothetical protein
MDETDTKQTNVILEAFINETNTEEIAVNIVNGTLETIFEPRTEITEPILEIKESLNKDNLINISKLILNEKITEILSNYKIIINEKELIKVLSLLNGILLTNTENNIPFNTIIDSITKALEDGKLELYEIPELILVINNNIKEVNIKKINKNEFGLLIKIIIVVLIETNIIKVNSNDLITTIRVIDSSIILLKNKINIPKISSLFSCFF